MEEGYIQIYFGEGQGKSSAALGHAVRCAADGGTVYVVRFLKEQMESSFFERLEPEFKLFRFERSPERYDDMSEEERQEEKQNLKNGINFARKVMTTDECDMLILDEVLGAIEEGIIDSEELVSALQSKSGTMRVILTGRRLTEDVRDIADSVLEIVKIKEERYEGGI